MAAYNFHRKIFEDPNNSTEVPDFCISQCDLSKNPTGNCNPVCCIICPTNCTIPDLDDSSPPLPTGSNILTPSEHHHSSLSLPLKISLVILVLTFSFFLIYTLYKFYTVWYRSRRRRSPEPPSPENQETHDEFLDQDVVDHPIWYIRTIGLQPSVINAITVLKYKTDGLIEGTSCSVCLSDFQEDEMLRLLPKCNHAFHISCIDTWLRSHTNCPLCRAGIVKNETGLDDLGQTEETHVVVSITDGSNGELRVTEDDDDDDRNSDLAVGIGGSETDNGFLNMRRSVSLNDHLACRVRSDVYNNNHNHNHYHSDRHDVQIQSVDGNLGFEPVKVDRTATNQN